MAYDSGEPLAHSAPVPPVCWRREVRFPMCRGSGLDAEVSCATKMGGRFLRCCDSIEGDDLQVIPDTEHRRRGTKLMDDIRTVCRRGELSSAAGAHTRGRLPLGRDECAGAENKTPSCTVLVPRP